MKSRKINGWMIAFFGLLIIFIALCTIPFTSTPKPVSTTNADGTSKAAVYTRLSDFGQYSDWAQKELKAGFSMCSLQNTLAQTDTAVAVVANCDSGTKCTSTQLGMEATTACTPFSK